MSQRGENLASLTAWWMKLFVSLVERARRLRYLLPEVRRLNRRQHVVGVAHNHGCFSGVAGDVCVFQGRELCTDDPSSWVHHALQCLPAVFSAAPAPHRDTAGQDAFNGAPVESDRGRSFRMLQFAKEVEAPLCFLHL